MLKKRQTPLVRLGEFGYIIEKLSLQAMHDTARWHDPGYQEAWMSYWLSWSKYTKLMLLLIYEKVEINLNVTDCYGYNDD